MFGCPPPPATRLVRCSVAGNQKPVRLVYQPPANSVFLSEQISHQQPVLFSHNKSAPATSQTNMLQVALKLENGFKRIQ
jgi:hypothetical protein